MENYKLIPQKIKHRLLYDAAILLQDPKELKAGLEEIFGHPCS